MFELKAQHSFLYIVVALGKEILGIRNSILPVFTTQMISNGLNKDLSVMYFLSYKRSIFTLVIYSIVAVIHVDEVNIYVLG